MSTYLKNGDGNLEETTAHAAVVTVHRRADLNQALTVAQARVAELEALIAQCVSLSVN